MSAPKIPTSYTFTLAGGMDVGLDDIRVNHLPTIRLDIEKIETDSRVDMGLDDIRIRELPKIELEVGIKPTRVHLPSHYNMCFSVLGMEVFKLAFCGESMVIMEPYRPHETEHCQ